VGRGNTIPFGSNVIEIPVNEVKSTMFDCILFQSQENYREDQYELFTSEQLEIIPKIYLEHDPPREHPTDTRHVMQDSKILMVHVTHFNQLMWNNDGVVSKVIEHGVVDPSIHYTGVLNRGAVVINNLYDRGRRLGSDIFLKVKKHIPLDLIGINSEKYAGIGEISLSQLPITLSCYRFLFNPIRYTSLGLAVCEAMMIGMPVVALATTEIPKTIVNGVSGYTDLDIDKLIEKMRVLMSDTDLAFAIGKEARKAAIDKFNIDRFCNEWQDTFNEVVYGHPVNERINALER
jgi:hypothetical protein